MPFWNTRREDGAVTDPEPLIEELEPIALFGAHGFVIEGSIHAMGGRLTEVLNSRHDIGVNLADDMGRMRWLRYALSDQVLIAAPPHTTDPSRRISRRLHRAVLLAGPYRIVGTAHLPPGGEFEAFLQRRPGWLPLTECTITTSEAEYEVDVAILNTAHIRATVPLQIPDGTPFAAPLFAPA
jgi:hypothetical protein